MNHSSILIAIYICLFPTLASAQRLVSRLPTDGANAVYDFTLTTNFGKNTDRRSGELTVQSVGEAKTNGKPARWLELKLEYQKGPDGPIDNFKVFNRILMYETDVQNNQAFAKSATQTWVQTSFNSELLTPKNDKYPELVHLLLPKIETLRKLESKSIKTNIGNLKCKGSIFEFTLPKEKATDPDTHVKYTTYVNDQSPFEAVKLNIESARSDGLNSKLEATLKSISRNAKPFIIVPQ